MSPELPCEDLQDLLPDPAALGERREGEVIRVNLAEALKQREMRFKLKLVAQETNFCGTFFA